MRRDIAEWTQFLVFAYLVLAILITQMSLAAVDQGLMSFRLAPYAGAMIGALAAMWTINSLRVTNAVRAGTQMQIAEQELPRVYRRRVRIISAV